MGFEHTGQFGNQTKSSFLVTAKPHYPEDGEANKGFAPAEKGAVREREAVECAPRSVAFACQS